MASGGLCNASSKPSRPELAVATVQPATTSRASCATAWISHSSSIIRIFQVIAAANGERSTTLETDEEYNYNCSVKNINVERLGIYTNLTNGFKGHIRTK